MPNALQVIGLNTITPQLEAGQTSNLDTYSMVSPLTINPSATSGYSGLALTVKGTIALNGSASGTVTMTPAAAAGTWTFTLPTTAGTSGYLLQTDGAGVTTWVGLVAAFNAIIPSLPTTLPATAGQLWNNGGSLSIS